MEQINLFETKLKPKHIDYSLWECYQNGMYESGLNQINVENCFDFFDKNTEIYEFMKITTKDYNNSAISKLTNQIFNPVSWLGQATCNNFFGANQEEVIKAWLMLSIEKRNNANQIAKKVIEEFHNENL